MAFDSHSICVSGRNLCYFFFINILVLSLEHTQSNARSISVQWMYSRESKESIYITNMYTLSIFGINVNEEEKKRFPKRLNKHFRVQTYELHILLSSYCVVAILTTHCAFARDYRRHFLTLSNLFCVLNARNRKVIHKFSFFSLFSFPTGFRLTSTLWVLFMCSWCLCICS